jgi:MEDS: MEthanogen/methylotroph, DcmR Sensory domain
MPEIFHVMFILLMHQFFPWRFGLLAGEKRILTYHVDDALEQINQSENGAHHLIIYPDLRVLRELYTKYIKTQLEHEHKIVLILPHYETADNLRKILVDAADDEDTIKNYEDSLIVIDSLKGHFGTGNHIAFVNDQVKRAQNGVLVIADAGPFFHLNKTDKLIEHELSMPSQFDVNLKRFCVFHRQDFNRLTEEQQQKLVNHHGQVFMVKVNS